jgi:hypothetical protein
MTDTAVSRLWPLALMSWLAAMPPSPRQADAAPLPDKAEQAVAPPADAADPREPDAGR